MKIIKVIMAILCVFSIAFTSFYDVKKISLDNEINTSFEGIITLWHIDTFEGGLGSRKQFLLKVARDFEKEFQGVLIMVVSHTITSAEKSVKEGIYPDLISYGNGLDVTGFSDINIERSFSAGKIGDKQYAIPWCRGGYVLIANPNLVKDIPKDLDSLLISKGEYSLPKTAMILSDIKAKNIEELSPMEAYVKFVNGKTPYLLGTQRDVNRLINRGMDFISKPLVAYNDLYQYISICTSNEEKRFCAESFIKLLLSDDIQNKLTDIGMMSVFNKLNYDNHIGELQKVSEFSVLSPFVGKTGIEEVKYYTDEYVKGDLKALIKIKNIIV